MPRGTEGCYAGAGPQTLPPVWEPSPKKKNPTIAEPYCAGRSGVVGLGALSWVRLVLSCHWEEAIPW